MLKEKFAEALGYARKIENLEQKIEQLKSYDLRKETLEAKLKEFDKRKLKSAIVPVCLITILSALMIFLFIERSLASFMFGIYYSAVPAIIIALIVIYLFRRKFIETERIRDCTEEEKSLISKNKAELEELKEELANYTQSLNSLDIPKRYAEADTLEWILEVVENKRASTEQEAYNLCEQFASEERRHKEQMDAIDNITIKNEYHYWG